MAILGDSTAISMNVLNTVEAGTIKKRGGTSSQFLKADGSVDNNTYKTTDTLNTTGATNKASTKMFIVGATSQGDNPVTYSNSSCYIGTDNCLYSGGNKVLTSYTNSFSTSAAFDGANANNGVKMTISGNTGFTSYNKTIPIANATNGTASWGVVKSTSTVTSTSGLSVCPIISGVVYYKDTDTKVTAVGNHYTPSGGSAATQTPGSAIGWGGTAVTGIAIDAAGHITGVTKGAIPSQPTDTKNTAGSTNSASKLFIVGATTQAANPQTYSNTAVYEQAGTFAATQVRVAEACTLQYDSTNQCLKFVF